MTLLEFILKLVGNDADAADLQDAFKHNPEATLNQVGLGNLTAVDVHDAIALVQDNDTVSFDRNYDSGFKGLASLHAPAPEAHHEAAGHKGAVEYINKYVTHTYVDDRDTTVDNSVNQNIDTHGGDLRQHFDNHSVTASGDGAVAAGGNISAPVTTGDHNVVGNGNQISGEGSTTAFGSGDATSTNVGHDLTIGQGAAFATGGTAGVDNSDKSVHDSFNSKSDSSINNSGNDSSDHSSHTWTHDESDNSTHFKLDDHSDSSQHTHVDTTTDNSVSDSLNTHIHL
ncbi:IniB N-terminal domain-containing protein [Pseudonocardia ailaonensis]